VACRSNDGTLHCTNRRAVAACRRNAACFEREIAKRLRLQRAVEVLDHARFDVFVLRCVEMYVVTLQHLLKRRMQKFRAFVRLQRFTNAARILSNASVT